MTESLEREMTESLGRVQLGEPRGVLHAAAPGMVL